jgi:hypothetical protein
MTGTTLLKIARLLLSAEVVSTIVQPTIADLQREIADAGDSRKGRLRARWRGYRAFWTVALVAPFAASVGPAARADGAAFPDTIRRVAVTSIVLTLVGLAGPALGGSATIIAGASTLVAILLHRWYVRHPSEMPTPNGKKMWSPQINFSSTDVAGNAGGLIFAVGSVFVVVIGVPSVIWFLVAGTAAGCIVAWALVVWHTKHPDYGLPANRIVFR